MLLEASQYLPSEEMKYSNFPEVYDNIDKINQIQKAMEPIISAITAFDEGTADGIYVNIAEVTRLRAVTFELTDILGVAPKVCYDVLMPLRDIQEALNELIFSYKYETAPVVYDIQSTDMARLNDVVTAEGDVI